MVASHRPGLQDETPAPRGRGCWSEVGRPMPNDDGVLEFFRMQRAGFPDLRMDPEDVLVSADKVVTRGKLTGTHQGELMGMPATGKSIDVQLIDIIRFGDDGLAHEHWGVVDMMAMMQ